VPQIASYARRLRIDLRSKKEEELFKWFLACLLFGKPIQSEIAERAFGELMAARLASPKAILRAGWDKLVLLLDRAHYVRYDFSTATKLLELSQGRIRAPLRYDHKSSRAGQDVGRAFTQAAGIQAYRASDGPYLSP
jgi:hypothetical protein